MACTVIDRNSGQSVIASVGEVLRRPWPRTPWKLPLPRRRVHSGRGLVDARKDRNAGLLEVRAPLGVGGIVDETGAVGSLREEYGGIRHEIEPMITDTGASHLLGDRV
jgi:hypothetical protein